MPSEYEDDESDEGEDVEYMLGFVEPPARPSDLLRHHFPSKLGGRPAWLDPVHLPSRDQLTCPASGRPLSFLLQVYAPLDDEAANEEAFHRAIFLFVTPQGSALTKPGAVRAFRCQLPRKNAFYGYEPPGPQDAAPQELPAGLVEQSLASDPWRVLEVEPQPSASTSTSSSKEAGSGGQGSQGGKQGGDEGDGASAGGLSASKFGGPHLFPESLLVVEPEDRGSEEEDALTAKLLSEYKARIEGEGELTEEDAPEEMLDHVEDNCSLEHKHFAVFQARVACAPSQAIRYCFRDGARPLWPSPANLPAAASIPPCARCGAPRKFEFQVMPQLLNHLQQDEMDADALDWGTLVVYTCSSSCGGGSGSTCSGGQSGAPCGPAYAEEFVWVQPAC